MEADLESLPTQEGTVCFEGYEEGSYFVEVRTPESSMRNRIALRIEKDD